MRASLVPALAIVALCAVTGCVSAFPASSLEGGRSAKALPQGTTRVQVGGGAGAAPLSLAAGAGAGARIEHQFLDDLAVGADLGAGVQLLGMFPTVMPVGSYVGLQWNPFGIQWLALRARAGGGVDVPSPAPLVAAASPNAAANSLEPYASIALQLALSFDLTEDLALYVVPGVGTKHYLIPPADSPSMSYGDSGRIFCSIDGACGIVDILLTPGASGGLEAKIADNLSFYIAGNLTAGVVLGRGLDVTPQVSGPIVALSPSANMQTGVAFTF